MFHVNQFSRTSDRTQPRGVAMLLVIVSLAMATILTTAYLASRDNSTAIGENVAEAATARWAADSALDLTIAVLETDSDWRTMHTNGMLFEYAPLAGALTSVELIDLTTNLPPTEKTEHVRITASALSGGIRKVTTAEAYVPREETGKTAEVDLSEFAVFSLQKTEVYNDAVIAPWKTSPALGVARGTQIGTRSNTMGNIVVKDKAMVVDATVYNGPGASSSLISNSTAQPINQETLLDDIPMPSPPGPGVASPTGLVILDLLLKLTNSITGTTRYRDVDLSNSGTVLRLKDGAVLVADRSMKLGSGTGILAEAGSSKIVVFGPLTLDNNSFIEVAPNAKLQIFVFDDVLIDDSYIGDQRANRTVYDTSATAPWMNPRRIRMFSIPRLKASDPINQPSWEMKDVSVVKASIYAPNATMDLHDKSSLFGRMAVNAAKVRQTASLFYDPTLDRGAGFTSRNSAIFQADGRIKPELLSLTSLESGELSTIAGLLGLVVKSGDESYGTASDDPYVPPPPGDPSPRPVPVDVTRSTSDMDVQAWEGGS